MTGNKQEAEAAAQHVPPSCLAHGAVCAVGGMRWRYGLGVGERSRQRRSGTETSRGAAASDYAGMSNDKAGENPARRKPKVSWGRYIRPGLVGPLVEAERRRRWTAG